MADKTTLDDKVAAPAKPPLKAKPPLNDGAKQELEKYNKTDGKTGGNKQSWRTHSWDKAKHKYKKPTAVLNGGIDIFKYGYPTYVLTHSPLLATGVGIATFPLGFYSWEGTVEAVDFATDALLPVDKTINTTGTTLYNIVSEPLKAYYEAAGNTVNYVAGSAGGASSKPTPTSAQKH